MIKLEEVGKVYHSENGDITAVDRLSLHVKKGEILCLIGVSGSGKTTVLEMVNRLVEPDYGRVLVKDEGVDRVDPIQLRRSIGYVVQKGGLFPHLTVAENVGLLCKLEQWSSTRIKERVDSLLSLVNLAPENYVNRYPRELSGGQQQRVSIARALALDPPVLLMDEPFGALDPITRNELRLEFLNLKSEMEQTVVIVTHDLNEAFLLGDRIALMNEGRLIQIGTERDFRDHPANRFVSQFVQAFEGDRSD